MQEQEQRYGRESAAAFGWGVYIYKKGELHAKAVGQLLGHRRDKKGQRDRISTRWDVGRGTRELKVGSSRIWYK